MSEPTLYRYDPKATNSLGRILVEEQIRHGVLVPVEPDKVVTTRYENMFGPCDFIDRIDVAEPGTYAIIRIGGDDGR